MSDGEDSDYQIIVNNSEYARIMAWNESAKNIQLKLEERIACLQKELHVLKQENKHYLHQLSERMERIKMLEQSVLKSVKNRYELDIELQRNKEITKNKIAQFSTRIQEMNLSNQIYVQEIQQLRESLQQLEKVKIQKQIQNQRLKSDQKQTENRLNDLTIQNSTLSEQSKISKIRQQQLQQQLKQIVETNQVLKEQHKKQAEIISFLKKRQNQNINQYYNIEQEIGQICNDKMTKQIGQYSQRIKALEAEIANLNLQISLDRNNKKQLLSDILYLSSEKVDLLKMIDVCKIQIRELEMLINQEDIIQNREDLYNILCYSDSTNNTKYSNFKNKIRNQIRSLNLSHQEQLKELKMQIQKIKNQNLVNKAQSSYLKTPRKQYIQHYFKTMIEGLKMYHFNRDKIIDELKKDSIKFKSDVDTIAQNNIRDLRR